MMNVILMIRNILIVIVSRYKNTTWRKRAILKIWVNISIIFLLVNIVVFVEVFVFGRKSNWKICFACCWHKTKLCSLQHIGGHYDWCSLNKPHVDLDIYITHHETKTIRRLPRISVYIKKEKSYTEVLKNCNDLAMHAL